ncbi:hypothetical protein [Radicibacter daui]|uniref:hypothetical protein n=1 Tax=Radicibacter daui TaxID=3064829 RepID=UPI004046DA95
MADQREFQASSPLDTVAREVQTEATEVVHPYDGLLINLLLGGPKFEDFDPRRENDAGRPIEF